MTSRDEVYRGRGSFLICVTSFMSDPFGRFVLAAKVSTKKF